MRTRDTRLILAAAIALVVALVPVMAQERQQAPQASQATGQLVRVDTTAKTLVIKSAAGAEMLFTYSDSTKVTGAEESVAGLATMSGADVTVHFTKKGQENIASQIDVQKKRPA